MGRNRAQEVADKVRNAKSEKEVTRIADQLVNEVGAARARRVIVEADLLVNPVY